VQLPIELAELTPAFFSWALELDVSHADMLDRSSGTTGRARVALRGAPGVPATVFVKLPPFDEAQRAFVNSVGMGVAEARFYRELATEVPVLVPKVWFADTDEDSRYVMVLEDLTANDCWFPTPQDDDIAARGLDIVEQLAALHAHYWESPRFDDQRDLGWLARKGTGGGGGGANFIRMAVDQLGDQFDESFHCIAELYLTRADDIARLWNSGPRTLVHGDPHLGNLFVDGRTDRTGFLDWAVLGRSPGLRDVAYVLCNSIPAEVRAAHEHAWIERYCKLLADAGVVLAVDDAWQQYRLFALYSWVSATATAGMGAKWQPLHIGLGGTRRATAACTELACVELLDALLP
jgi:phosphotransferase family enzyme